MDHRSFHFDFAFRLRSEPHFEFESELEIAITDDSRPTVDSGRPTIDRFDFHFDFDSNGCFLTKVNEMGF